MADLRGLHLLLVILTYLPTSSLADELSVCSTRTIPAVTSTVLLQSPGFPASYTGYHECTLTIPVPAYSLITVVVNGGDFSLPDSSNCVTSTQGFLAIETSPQNSKVFCGTRTAATELYRFYSRRSYNIKVKVRFRSRLSQGDSEDYKFNIEYTVFNVLDADVARSIPSQSQLYFTSHSQYNRMSRYGNNINSFLNITNLLPHTTVRLEFPDGIKMANFDHCLDYMDIVGVRGFPGYTKRVCRNNAMMSVNLISTGSEITLRFKTDSTGRATGFSLSYTIISEGCSYDNSYFNATLSPTPGSNSTFTMTCLPGFKVSESTRTQIVECGRGQWTPSLLPCHYVRGTTTTTTTTSTTATTTVTTTAATTARTTTRTTTVSTSKSIVSTLTGTKKNTTKSPLHLASTTPLIPAVTSAGLSSASSKSLTVIFASIGGGVGAIVMLVVLITVVIMKRRQRQRSPGKNIKTSLQQLSERERTTDGGQRAGDTSIYTLADSAYELSDSYQLAGPAGEMESPSTLYSLAGPITETERSNKKTAKGAIKEKVADVYAVVDTSHKRRKPPSIPVDEESSDTDEGDETPSGNYTLAGPVQGGYSNGTAINRVQREKQVADVYADIGVSHKRRPPAAHVGVDRNDMAENDLYTSSF